MENSHSSSIGQFLRNLGHPASHKGGDMGGSWQEGVGCGRNWVLGSEKAGLEFGCCCSLAW